MIETGKIINGDCVEVMKTLPEGFVDLIVTSPPYGVGIAYDVHEDDVEFEDYKVFSKQWLDEVYRILKDDGRIALNIPYEINRQKKGGRIFFVSEMWQIMKEIGYGFFGIVDLEAPTGQGVAEVDDRSTHVIRGERIHNHTHAMELGTQVIRTALVEDHAVLHAAAATGLHEDPQALACVLCITGQHGRNLLSSALGDSDN